LDAVVREGLLFLFRENECYEKPEQLQELINVAGFRVLTAVVLMCCISVESQPPFPRACHFHLQGNTRSHAGNQREAAGK
jgi:hypothetical protein